MIINHRGWQICIKDLSIVNMILLAAILLSGCNPFAYLGEGPWLEKRQAKVEKYIDEHSELDERIKRLILNHNIGVGLTKEQIKLNVNYDHPDKIAYTTKYDADELWIYRSGNYPVYLYFKGDTLIEIEPQHLKEWYSEQ